MTLSNEQPENDAGTPAASGHWQLLRDVVALEALIKQEYDKGSVVRSVKESTDSLIRKIRKIPYD